MKIFYPLFSWILLFSLSAFSLGTYREIGAAAQPDGIALEVDTTEDFNDPTHQMCTPQPDDCSLRGAILHANQESDQLFIVKIKKMTYNLSLRGSDDLGMTGDLDIHLKLRFEGQSSLDSKIDAHQIDRVIQVHPGADVTINDMKIMNGKAGFSEGGGGIYNAGKLDVNSVKITDNRSGDGPLSTQDVPGGPGGPGGGVMNTGSLRLFGVTISGNHTGIGGDGVHGSGKDGGNGGDGGGLANYGRAEIFGGQIAGNAAENGGDGGDGSPEGIGGNGGNGGGIYNRSFLLIENTDISFNQSGYSGETGLNLGCAKCLSHAGAPGFGGGIYNDGYLKINGKSIGDNKTAEAKPDVINCPKCFRVGHGGGIYNAEHRSLIIRNCIVHRNYASGLGGGINNEGLLDFSELYIAENNSRQSGGGINNSGIMNGKGTTIIHNISGPGYEGLSYFFVSKGFDGESPHGGGLNNAGSGYIADTRFYDNVAGDGGTGSEGAFLVHSGKGGDGGSGGGIYNSGYLEIYLAEISGNRTGKGGKAGQWRENGVGGSGGGIINSGQIIAAYLSISENLTNHGFSFSEPGGSGGGIANLGDLTLKESQVIKNRSAPGGNGGGLFFGTNDGGSNDAIIQNTEVISNSASAFGGGLYINGGDSQWDNLIVAGNNAGEYPFGHGFFLANNETRINHLTVVNNTPSYGTGIYALSGTATITNSIVAGQYTGIAAAEQANVSMEGTLWGAEPWANHQDWVSVGSMVTGTQNIWADPLFENPLQMDYHLSAASPAIDAGVASSLDLDMDNQPRPNPSSNLPDIGADETWFVNHMEGVEITAPTAITATVPVSISASIIPEDATPNVSFIWMPPPLSGQLTAQPSFVFEGFGPHDVTVWAVQAEAQVSSTITLQVGPFIRHYYFPLVGGAQQP